MEKGKSEIAEITSSLKKLRVDYLQGIIPSTSPSRSLFEKTRPRTLVSLCLGIIGQHFEDIIGDLVAISVQFPTEIKMTMAAIARRRKLLNDEVLIALVDNSWDLLDIAGSDVTDFGLAKVAQICTSLRAVDISRCDNVTVAGVSDLLYRCHALEILRCGGCPRSEVTARRCLGMLKPKLNVVEEESWEELDNMEIVNGAQQSLRWLVWPKIDEDSRESLATECPRITVNPQPSLFGINGARIPVGALPGMALDDPFVKDIDPSTWSISVPSQRIRVPSLSDDRPDLPIAERFRLAFAERDMRLAPKRAKNARQHRRRAEREWVMTSTDAKSIALASQANKFLHNRS